MSDYINNPSNKPLPSLSVCATCPWRKPLQGKPHPNGWYLAVNLKRLWNGLRTGAAPGMVCHASDPDSVDYGATKKVPESSTKRECAGALQLVYLEMNFLNQSVNIKEYRGLRKFPLTKTAIARWLERYIFGQTPAIVKCDDVGFPWEQEK